MSIDRTISSIIYIVKSKEQMELCHNKIYNIDKPIYHAGSQ